VLIVDSEETIKENNAAEAQEEPKEEAKKKEHYKADEVAAEEAKKKEYYKAKEVAAEETKKKDYYKTKEKPAEEAKKDEYYKAKEVAAEETKKEEPAKEETTEEKPAKEEPKTEEKPKESGTFGIYAIRTTANKEKNVATKLADRIARENYDISAIVIPGLKGYILVEGEKHDIDRMYRGVAHARGLVDGKTKIDEIKHFLTPKPAVTNLGEGYLVEVTSGPFKGEKAKITRVDKVKNEITIELVEATVSIPITVTAESVRVLEKEV